MGDRTYARFSIPLAALTTTERRRAVAAAFGVSLRKLTAICQQDPAANEPTAGYGNETALRLVQGVPCVVFEDDDANYGGSYTEDDLQSAEVPFLRFHLAGGSYGPGRAAYTGRGQMEWTDCDCDANPFIRADVVNGAAVFDPNAVAAINRLLAAERTVLRGGKKRPTPHSQKKTMS